MLAYVLAPVLFIAVLFQVAPAQASEVQLAVDGVTLTLPNPLVCPANGKSLDLEMSIVNPHNETINSAEMYFLDKAGSNVRGAFAYILKPNSTTPLFITLVELSSFEKCTEITQISFKVGFGYSSKYSGGRKYKEISVSQLGNPNPIHAAPVVSIPSPTPTPSPTVTVTASPSPLPTVYIQNEADKELVGSIAILRSQVNSLNAKIKKICSAKPKPKGC